MPELQLTRRRFDMPDGSYTLRSVAADRPQRQLLLERLDFDLAKADARKVHARLEGGRVVLPRDVRSQLLRGERPAITCWGREECPIRVGMEYRLMGENFMIRFTEIRRNRKGHHRLVYLVRDLRPVTLQTKPTDSYARRSERQHWSAAEEHGYSRSADLLDAGDVLDPIDQREIDKQAEVRGGQQDALTKARRERYELDQRLGRVLDRAEHERIDISSDVRVIKKRIEALERRVVDKAA